MILSRRCKNRLGGDRLRRLQSIHLNLECLQAREEEIANRKKEIMVLKNQRSAAISEEECCKLIVDMEKVRRLCVYLNNILSIKLCNVCLKLENSVIGNLMLFHFYRVSIN